MMSRYLEHLCLLLTTMCVWSCERGLYTPDQEVMNQKLDQSMSGSPDVALDFASQPSDSTMEDASVDSKLPDSDEGSSLLCLIPEGVNDLEGLQW